MLETMYYIRGSSGCYDDYRTWVVSVYDSKQDADDYCALLKHLSQKIDEKRNDLMSKTSDHEPDTKGYEKAWNIYNNFTDQHGYEEIDYCVIEAKHNAKFNERSKLP